MHIILNFIIKRTGVLYTLLAVVVIDPDPLVSFPRTIQTLLSAAQQRWNCSIKEATRIRGHGTLICL